MRLIKNFLKKMIKNAIKAVTLYTMSGLTIRRPAKKTKIQRRKRGEYAVRVSSADLRRLANFISTGDTSIE